MKRQRVLTPDQFITNLQDYTSCSTALATASYFAVVKTLRHCLTKGDGVVLSGVGKLTLRKSKIKVARDFTTGNKIIVPSTLKVKFHPAEDFQRELSKLCPQ